MVDGGVGLDVVVERRVLNVTVKRADDPRRHRRTEAEWIADRQNGVPDTQALAVAPFQRRQRPTGIHLQHREVDHGSNREQLAGTLSPLSKITLMSRAPSMTCLLVTIIPLGSMMKPEP